MLTDTVCIVWYNMDDKRLSENLKYVFLVFCKITSHFNFLIRNSYTYIDYDEVDKFIPMSVFVISWPLPGDASSSSVLQRLKAGDVDNNNSVVIYVARCRSCWLLSSQLSQFVFLFLVRQ